ncbi:MAG: polysaccharide deacetylase family protein [Lachnospiraceae bacterium]|nr:polysaccharide deacetylase family protein [Lachnospiraceae bacterium]
MKKFLMVILCLSVVIIGCDNISQEYNIHAEIAPVKDDKECIITIVSDDGIYESGVHFNELAKKYGLRVTVAGVVDIVSPHLDEWIDIEQQGYVEVISHSYSHLKMSEENNYSEEELRHQITDSINYFKEHFQTDQIAFIPPENVMCNKGYDILKENDIYAIRQGVRGENSLLPLEGTWPSQWYDLYTSGICDIDTTEYRNSRIDSAIDNKTWLIEMWHNVYQDNEEVGYQGISVELADEHLSYIAQMADQDKVWVASLVDATKYLYEKQYTDVQAIQRGNMIEVQVALDTSKIPADIFDFPVTVKIPLPQDWLGEDIESEDQSIDVRIEEKNNVKYILFNVVPNGKSISIIKK